MCCWLLSVALVLLSLWGPLMYPRQKLGRPGHSREEGKGLQGGVCYRLLWQWTGRVWWKGAGEGPSVWWGLKGPQLTRVQQR